MEKTDNPVRYKNLKYLDICIALIIIVSAMSLLIYGKTLNLTYVPSAVTGFTTISGIIIAFIGLLISHIYTQERTDRKIWTKYRFLMVIATVFMSMVFVIGGLVKLAEGNLILAYKLASIGILSTSLNVVFLPQNLKA